MKCRGRRVVSLVNRVALLTFLLTLLVGSVVLNASAGAPPPVERRSMDYHDPPAAVVADAVHNLRAAEYTYHVRVEDTGDRVPWTDENATGRSLSGSGHVTTLVQHTAVDNGARRYLTRTAPPVEDGVSVDGPYARAYSEGPEGYLSLPGPLGVENGWTHIGSDRYHPSFRNPLDRTEGLAVANATVVRSNRSTYVARITDTDVAVDVGHPDGLYSSNPPPAADATANLTVVVDRPTGHVERAVLRYYHPPSGRHLVATYEFEGYGATTVSRPPATLPPSPAVLFYRLDLGLWAMGQAPGVWAGVPLAAAWLLVAVRYGRAEP